MKQLILLLAAAVTPAFASSLVVNGGFETGNLSGWTVSGQPQFFLVCANRTELMGAFCTSFQGEFAGAFGPPTVETISEDLATIPGDSYNITFALRSDSLGKTPNSIFDFSFAGAQLMLTNLPTTSYKLYTINDVTATSANTPLTFSLFNVPGAFFVDNVAVSEIPEPSLFFPAATLLCVLGFFKLRRKAG